VILLFIDSFLSFLSWVLNLSFVVVRAVLPYSIMLFTLASLILLRGLRARWMKKADIMKPYIRMCVDENNKPAPAIYAE